MWGGGRLDLTQLPAALSGDLAALQGCGYSLFRLSPVPRPKLPSAALGPPAGPACPDGWVGYQGKCYYFSEAKGNWTYSQRHCSSLNASLAGIDSEQEMAFVLRYKGKFDHWIGLRRDPGQPWKWANGTEFNNLCLLFPIGGGGDCMYLNDLGGVSSSQCTSARHWICTKPMHLQR